MNMTKTKIKKVWSENPRLTKAISMKEALEGYYAYLGSCLEQYARDVEWNKERGSSTPPLTIDELKNFKQWLRTEL